MIPRIRSNLVRLMVCISLLGLFLTSCGIDKIPDTISGMVFDEHGPVANAVVREQGTENHTTTDANGNYFLSELTSQGPAIITAWKSGYFIACVQEVMPGMKDIDIYIEAHAKFDNPGYAWLPSQFHPGQGENQGCAECHSNEKSNLSFALPFDEWLQDAHSQTAVNSRFLTMYAGTDVQGNQSPLTNYGKIRDYGQFPLLPDPSKPYFGPGYKLDYPATDGNCAACHAPAGSVDNPYGVNPINLTGVSAEGIPCDFCHKVWDVRFDSSFGLPRPNMPGVLSYEFRRPPDGDQFFAGPLDDVAPGHDTYSPLQEQSQFCAPCHFGIFWDTLIYNSFGEWLESPYSDSETGQTCQDCHMPPSGATHFALPEAGGLERDPATIFSHRMLGASDEILLQNAVTMRVEAHHEGNKVIVEVTITNDLTGHHVPTDSPLRHLILLVEVADSKGKILEQIGGLVIPEWGGIGNSEAGYYAGLPGTAYAKILQELWTGVSPSGAYWNRTQIISDNRIPAMGSDTTRYIFDAESETNTSVSVKLLFRRAFIELMDQKGWEKSDIVMETETFLLP